MSVLRPLVVLVLLSACKARPTEVLSDPDAGGGPHLRAGLDADGPAGPTTREQAVATLNANFARVHFALDSARLEPDAARALDDNAAVLRAWPSLVVEVQGHADARGTVDYNLALGQRRARAVIDHLVARGVPAGRLVAVSYGEERPLSAAGGESAWAMDRRAEFRVLTPGVGVRGTVSP